MATFLVRSSKFPSHVSFYSNGIMQKFLKPEEFGQAIVSEPLHSDILKEGLGQEWLDFVHAINQLLHRGHDTEQLNLNGDVRRDGYRMVLCRASKTNRDDGQLEVVRVPMKVKLISKIPLNASRSQREQGYLAQVAKLCGHENMAVAVTIVDSVNMVTLPELKMSWSEKDLCWETDTQLIFPEVTLSHFGKEGGHFSIEVGKVELNLNNAAVARALQRLYGKPDGSWRTQKQLLESGDFSDMEILSTSGGNIPIKCHRFNLAAASPVFAKMLEEDKELQGPSEAKRGKWKEAQERTVELAESEEAIHAMLHFTYYGGCERIFRNRVDILLELLEAGEKYEIPNLKNVAAFVLMTDAQECNWFTVDAAMKLFNFARRLEGKLWRDLKARSVEFLVNQPKETLMASAAYQELHDVATRLGPVFVFMLETETTLSDSEDGDDDWKPTSFPKIEQNVTKAEAVAIYDWIDCRDFASTLNLDMAVGIMVLAEFCGVPISAVEGFSSSSLAEQFLNDHQFQRYEVDYLVELFCYFRQKENDKELKMGAVRLLQAYMVEDRQKVLESKNYWEMLHKAPKAFEEFTWLSNMEFAGDIKKRMQDFRSPMETVFSDNDTASRTPSAVFHSPDPYMRSPRRSPNLLF